MPSISSITQQYAKQQQQQQQQQQQENKNTQKGGAAMFDFLSSDNKNNQVTGNNSTLSTKPVAPPAEEDKGFLTKAGETLKETLGLGNSEKEDALSKDNNSLKPETEEENKGLFGFGSDKNEEDKKVEAPIATSNNNEPKQEEETKDDNTGFFGFSFGSKAKEETSNKTTSDNESESGSESGSESESGSDYEEEDNENGFEMIAQEMKKLHDKYDKLKQEHANLKSQMENEKAEQANKDNSQFSTLVAAFFAAEGSLTQLKKSLIEHAKNNSYSLVGTGLDAGSASTDAEEEPVPEPVLAAAQPPSTTSQAETISSSAPQNASETSIMPETTENDESNVNAESGEAGEAAETGTQSSLSMSSDSETSQSDSGSEVSDSDSEVENAAADAGSGSVPQPGDEIQSSVPEIPVNETPDETTSTGVASPAEAPSAAQGTSSVPPPPQVPAVINGGRTHYSHSATKHHKTHRHHKRRNRHQTLRSNKK
jgi:hypothetical protein